MSASINLNVYLEFRKCKIIGVDGVSKLLNPTSDVLFRQFFCKKSLWVASTFRLVILPVRNFIRVSLKVALHRFRNLVTMMLTEGLSCFCLARCFTQASELQVLLQEEAFVLCFWILPTDFVERHPRVIKLLIESEINFHFLFIMLYLVGAVGLEPTAF